MKNFKAFVVLCGIIFEVLFATSCKPRAIEESNVSAKDGDVDSSKTYLVYKPAVKFKLKYHFAKRGLWMIRFHCVEPAVPPECAWGVMSWAALRDRGDVETEKYFEERFKVLESSLRIANLEKSLAATKLEVAIKDLTSRINAERSAFENFKIRYDLENEFDKRRVAYRSIATNFAEDHLFVKEWEASQLLSLGSLGLQACIIDVDARRKCWGRINQVSQAENDSALQWRFLDTFGSRGVLLSGEYKDLDFIEDENALNASSAKQPLRLIAAGYVIDGFSRLYRYDSRSSVTFEKIPNAEKVVRADSELILSRDGKLTAKSTSTFAMSRVLDFRDACILDFDGNMKGFYRRVDGEVMTCKFPQLAKTSANVLVRFENSIFYGGIAVDAFGKAFYSQRFGLNAIEFMKKNFDARWRISIGEIGILLDGRIIHDDRPEVSGMKDGYRTGQYIPEDFDLSLAAYGVTF